jgi:hypothetical protein
MTLGKSNATPEVERFRTMQLKAAPLNSIVPAFRTGRRGAARLSMAARYHQRFKKLMNMRHWLMLPSVTLC